MAEERDVCPGCGQAVDECRDSKTMGQWEVVSQTCEACRVAQAVMDNNAQAEKPPRGLYLATRRRTTGG